MNSRIGEDVIFQSCGIRPQHKTGRFPFIFEIIEYICNGRSFRGSLVRHSFDKRGYTGPA